MTDIFENWLPGHIALYDESWKQGALPFRNYKLKWTDKLYIISKYGLNYMKTKTRKYQHKLVLNYLGVKKPYKLRKPDNQVPLIVSCSSIIERKRVDLIPEVLHNIEIPLKWIHFGDGELKKQVMAKASGLPEHIDFEIKGSVPNDEILSFYSCHKVDMFISLSISEGLPVSMMEAISYGIPVFAMNICGVPEIVNKTTGILIGKKTGVKTIASVLRDTLKNKKFNKEAIINYFVDNFEAENNYMRFVKNIKSLK